MPQRAKQKRMFLVGGIFWFLISAACLAVPGAAGGDLSTAAPEEGIPGTGSSIAGGNTAAPTPRPAATVRPIAPPLTETPLANLPTLTLPAPTDTPASLNLAGALPTATAEAVRQVSPDELLPYLSWDAGGAGPGPEICNHGQPEINFFYYPGSDLLAVVGKYGDTMALGQMMYVEGCVFQPNESVSLTYRLPNGTTVPVQFSADEDGNWRRTWASYPDDPLGDYQVSVETSSTSLTAVFHVVAPTSPVMVSHCSKKYGNQLVLTGFQPHEQVLIGWYHGDIASGDLRQTWELTTGNDGSVIMDMPSQSEDETMYVAIGSESPWEAQVGTGDSMYVSAFDYSFCQDK